ncbi:MAG: YHS domain-containing protein [Magnetococcales bacterium]|nr:YHS domain-containing protein [Magnetococcales bacterium]
MLLLPWKPASAIDVIYTGTFSNLAIDGYDPVAYFSKSQPVKGRKSYVYSWMGAEWRFASVENREAFQSDPEKYAPQYGGYCSWAVSRGYTASGDPDAWTIHKGKLYLNYSKNVRRQWLMDIPGNISKGDTNWPELLSASQ